MADNQVATVFKYGDSWKLTDLLQSWILKQTLKLLVLLAVDRTCILPHTHLGTHTHTYTHYEYIGHRYKQHTELSDTFKAHEWTSVAQASPFVTTPCLWWPAVSTAPAGCSAHVAPPHQTALQKRASFGSKPPCWSPHQHQWSSSRSWGDSWSKGAERRGE